MPRATMAALIARVQLMIFDTGGSPLFTTDQIQDKLDECRDEFRYLGLIAMPTFTTTGIQYNDYYAIVNGVQRGMWEADETLIYGNFTTLTPTSSDELVGHWTFNNQLPPVLLAGKSYDIYRAAADLLDYKVASLAATQVDFTADGQSFHLSQQITFLQKTASNYRRKQRARLGAQGRADGPNVRPYGVAPNQADIAGPVSANVPFLMGE